ncbi:hypothetical protein ES703_118749 [subsurface metagenome]
MGVAGMVLVIGFQVNDRPRWARLPRGGGRPGYQPAQAPFGIAVPALVADKIKPRFFTKVVPDPVSARGVQGHQAFVPVAEHRPSDTFPAVDPLRRIPPVPSQEPGHGMTSPPGDNVAYQADGIRFRENLSRVGLG